VPASIQGGGLSAPGVVAATLQLATHTEPFQHFDEPCRPPARPDGAADTSGLHAALDAAGGGRTSGLPAYFDGSEPDHAAIEEILASRSGLLIVSPYVMAELDYLVATRHGVKTELAVLDELTSGAWELVGFDVDEVKQARSIIANTATKRSVSPTRPSSYWPIATGPGPS
jgi:hypothetical protein